MREKYQPITGCAIFKALRDKGCIVLAANIRIAKGVAEGIFQAAKDADAALIVELAKSECDLEGGYTGFTPGLFSRTMHEAASETGFDIWALHADHLTVKKGDAEEIKMLESLIATQIGAGYTSFAVDASFLFDETGKTCEAQLARNIEVTARLVKFIKEKCEMLKCGLEVEVGEIGKKNEAGLVVTSPEEATTFISCLNERGVEPHVLAIANGSSHGFTYDAHGKRIEQVSIDIAQTKAVAQSLRDMGSDVRLGQHGITGTPLSLITSQFPKGDIIKGNVGTLWMNLVWEVLKEYEQELYKMIFDWVLSTFVEKAAEKNIVEEQQVFDTFSKYAIKQFFDEIYAVSDKTEEKIKTRAYEEATKFFEAFNSIDSAAQVRDFIKRDNSCVLV